MKKRTRSRSRSRSRSHSPAHNREKKYPRGYQNNREFRGYHRGFRRPYNFRGRGRGYFPRGRYQRGGGGGGGALVPANLNSRDVKEERSASKEVQRGGGGGGGAGGDGEPVELLGVLAGEAKEGSSCGRSEGIWQNLTDCSSSSKRAVPLESSEVIVGQNTQTTSQASPSMKITNDNSNGAPSWQMASSSCTTKNPTQEGLLPMLSNFDFFSNMEHLDGDKAAISIAFKKFLEEHCKKAKSAWENDKNSEANEVDMEQVKANGKASAGMSDSVARTFKENADEVSLNKFWKASPFLPDDGEEEEEMIIKPHSVSFHKDWHNGDESSKTKSKVTHSAQELFEECLGKWGNVAYSQGANSDLDAVAEDMYLSRKQNKAAGLAAALAKREMAGKLEELSPERGCKSRKMTDSSSVTSSTLPTRRNSDREMFMVRGEASRNQEAKFNIRMDFLGDNLTSSCDILAEERQLSQDLVQSSKKDQEFRSIFQHVQAAQLQRSPSELFAQHIVTIVHHIKAQHFPSGMTLNERFTLYQRQAAEKEMMKLRKSPEIHRRIDVSPSAFKKHSQLFEAMKTEDGTYKDGGEKMKGDPMDLRLDIERRKKYSSHEKDYNQHQGRDEGESPDSSRERPPEKSSKRHKKSKKSKKKRSRSSSSSSCSSSKSQKAEEFSHDKSDPKDEGFNRARLGQRDSVGPGERGRPRGGFQVQIRGRGWNKGNYQGNSSHSNPTNMAAHPKNEDWDPEYTPKSKKYFLHDDRDDEIDCKWMDNRGRGRGGFLRGRARFIIRKTTISPNNKNPKWAHDKFQVNGQQRSFTQEEEREQDHKDLKIEGEKT
ncbi:hypothetical protein LDENG_00028010 [Lucifuga dentata]|nr:hypothetical protein LDENG_00028010 [Lucifuga dentata]